jgi:flagellar basal body-associated protein FliL
MKKLVLLLLPVLLLAGGAGAYFTLSKSAKPHKKAGAAQAPAETVTLDEFVANLADLARPHYLKLTLALEVDGGKAQEKVKEAGPYLRDVILMTLCKQKYADLLSEAGKRSLKRELLASVGRVLEKRETNVTDILFTSFVMD